MADKNLSATMENMSLSETSGQISIKQVLNQMGTMANGFDTQDNYVSLWIYGEIFKRRTSGVRLSVDLSFAELHKTLIESKLKGSWDVKIGELDFQHGIMSKSVEDAKVQKIILGKVAEILEKVPRLVLLVEDSLKTFSILNSLCEELDVKLNLNTTAKIIDVVQDYDNLIIDGLVTGSGFEGFCRKVCLGQDWSSICILFQNALQRAGIDDVDEFDSDYSETWSEMVEKYENPGEELSIRDEMRMEKMGYGFGRSYGYDDEEDVDEYGYGYEDFTKKPSQQDILKALQSHLALPKPKAKKKPAPRKKK